MASDMEETNGEILDTVPDLFRKLFELESVSVYAIDSEKTKTVDSNTQQILEGVLMELRKRQLDSMSMQDLAYCIMIASAATVRERWTTCASNEEALSLLNNILTLKGCQESSWNSLFSAHKDLVTIISHHVKSTLRRDQWQDKALTCSVFVWYCTNLKFPLVSDNLDILLPPCLNFIDSYVDDVKLKGVNCLYHILSESGMAELRWHARSQVIYDALQKLTYTRDPNLVSTLYPALIKILRVMDTSDNAQQNRLAEGDAVFSKLLSDMYLEDKLLLRKAYISSLLLFTDYYTKRIIKHLKLAMKVVLGYLECSCGPSELTRITTLAVLSRIMKYCSPRIASYDIIIIKTLLRLLVDIAITQSDADTRAIILSEVAGIMKIVYTRQPQLVSGSINNIIPEVQAQDKILLDSLKGLLKAVNS